MFVCNIFIASYLFILQAFLTSMAELRRAAADYLHKTKNVDYQVELNKLLTKAFAVRASVESALKLPLVPISPLNPRPDVVMASTPDMIKTPGADGSTPLGVISTPVSMATPTFGTDQASKQNYPDHSFVIICLIIDVAQCCNVSVDARIRSPRSFSTTKRLHARKMIGRGSLSF